MDLNANSDISAELLDQAVQYRTLLQKTHLQRKNNDEEHHSEQSHENVTQDRAVITKPFILARLCFWDKAGHIPAARSLITGVFIRILPQRLMKDIAGILQIMQRFQERTERKSSSSLYVAHPGEKELRLCSISRSI